jgi:predicted TIM-barrel fold metal-dependent hydrolase
MIIDFHARLTPDLLSTMDSCGIDRAVVAAGGLLDLGRLSAQIVHGGQTRVDADNAAVLAAGRAHPDRLVPWYFANPHDRTGAYAREGAAFRGVEISPAVHGVGFADPRVRALVEVAAGLGHAVYTVCVVAAGAGTADFLALAGAYPGTTFVFGHCGFIGIDVHAIESVASRPNVVVETSGCFTVTARRAVDRLGPGRVLFGTEHPLQHPRVELAKFAALDLPAAAWRRIACDNALSLLGEEPSWDTATRTGSTSRT